MWVMGAAAAIAAALLFAVAAAAQPRACDRACLEGFLDAYVDAVVAHDAATRIRDRRFVLVDPERGLIGPVESVLHAVPYDASSGWSTWERWLSSEPSTIAP
jgi:hypothetical protein